MHRTNYVDSDISNHLLDVNENDFGYVTYPADSFGAKSFLRKFIAPVVLPKKNAQTVVAANKAISVLKPSIPKAVNASNAVNPNIPKPFPVSNTVNVNTPGQIGTSAGATTMDSNAAQMQTLGGGGGDISGSGGGGSMEDTLIPNGETSTPTDPKELSGVTVGNNPISWTMIIIIAAVVILAIIVLPKLFKKK